MVVKIREITFKRCQFLILVLLAIVYVDCKLSDYNPRGMDYELRRPITYLYNRLAYKFDFNPYTSHLIDTGSQCSSRTGPYCKFINKKEIMPVHIAMTPADKSVHQILIASAESNREAAIQIELGKLDAFLISGDYNKKFDQSVKEFIDKDFYEQVPSHQKLLNIKRPNQIKRTKSVLLPN